jgi:hypothetical protein
LRAELAKLFRDLFVRHGVCFDGTVGFRIADLSVDSGRRPGDGAEPGVCVERRSGRLAVAALPLPPLADGKQRTGKPVAPKQAVLRKQESVIHDCRARGMARRMEVSRTCSAR